MYPKPPRTTLLAILFFLVNQSVFAQPANDNFNCASPVVLIPQTSCVTTNGDFFNCTIGSPTSTCGTTYDVWYAFDVPSGVTAADITVAPIAAGGSNFTTANTYTQAFSESGCTLTPQGVCTPISSTLS